MQSDGLEIDVHILASMLAENVPHTVLDVREADEIAICKIDGSRSIPMQQVPQHLDTLPREQPLIILCHHGMRSAMVADFLQKNGFSNALNLVGGISAWARHIDPNMPRY